MRGELAGGRKAGAIGAEIQLLQIVLIALRDRRAAEDAAPSARPELVDRFVALVEARYREHPDLETLSAELGVTSAQLRVACQAATSLTPLAILHGRITSEAKRSLTYTTMSVAEIGYSLGFADPPYFTRFFTRTAGVSPTRFRKG